MAKSTGGGGSGGRGSGPDMTSPVQSMGLNETIKNIYSVRQAITAHSAEMNSNKFYEGSRETRKEMRAKSEALDQRHTALTNSITRKMTGEKGNYRETLVKGKETKDLGPWKGSWSQHYGTV